MRFLGLVRTDTSMGPPPQALMDAMGPFVQQQLHTGHLVDTGGLEPPSATRRVRLADGKINVLDGPYSEAKEVVGGYAIMEFDTKEEALEMARQFVELHAKHWPGCVMECEVHDLCSMGTGS